MLKPPCSPFPWSCSSVDVYKGQTVACLNLTLPPCFSGTEVLGKHGKIRSASLPDLPKWELPPISRLFFITEEFWHFISCTWRALKTAGPVVLCSYSPIFMPVFFWIASALIFTYTAAAATATSDAQYRARNARPSRSHAGMVAQSTKSPYQVTRPPETPEKEGKGSRQSYDNYQGSEVRLRRGSSGEGLGRCSLNYLEAVSWGPSTRIRVIPGVILRLTVSGKPEITAQGIVQTPLAIIAHHENPFLGIRTLKVKWGNIKSEKDFRIQEFRGIIRIRRSRESIVHVEKKVAYFPSHSMCVGKALNPQNFLSLQH